jgi:Na+/proline symporter
MQPDYLYYFAAALVLVGPLLYALWRARQTSRDDFLFNSGQTGLVATMAGIVCGNIGAGTFVALLLFSQVSPIIGLSLACAYGLGLLLCGALAPFIYKQSQRYQVHGLIDLIMVTHRISRPAFVWVPIALVFMMRAAVQLLALATILTALLPLSNMMAIVLAGVLTGTYTAIGGYRVATETDIVQAIIILCGIFVLTLTNIGQPSLATPFFDLGPYKLPLLVGVWLFIPVSAVLAIDNWQRMATARTPQLARKAFFLAAPLCFVCYIAIFWLGVSGKGDGNMLAALRNAMPGQLPWLADIMLIAVLMSTIDTFVMPLMTSFERTRLSLAQLQMIVFTLFVALVLAAIAFGPLLNTIIAAFSSLVVFLPTVLATLYAKNRNALSAIASLNIGLLVSLIFVRIDLNYAALVGFGGAGLVYGVFWRWPSFVPGLVIRVRARLAPERR